MRILIQGLSILGFLFIASMGTAQEGTVRGHIYDKNTGEPIIYSNMVLDGTTYGTNSDFEGFFNFSGIPVGKYILTGTYLGYDTISVEVEVKDGGITNKTLYLEESSVNLGVVNISASREVARTEVQISKIQVTPKQIKALPSTGGDADIVQYLQVLPGVISTGDQGGQLFIRGGSPVQNKILLDGLTIYNPFHSIGFYSIFETEIIRNVDVLTGGFNAEHGGRISAIVDINTREGNRSRVAGQLSASPFMVKALVETPIIKFEEGKGSTSLILTAKKSIIDQTSKSLYNYATPSDSLGLPFEFLDMYGKLSMITSNGSKFNFFGFNFADTYNNPSIAKIDWTNYGGGTNFTLVPTSSGMILGGLIGFSEYAVGLKEDNDNPRSSKIREITVGLDFTIFGKDSEFNYGFDVKGIRTDFNFTNPFGSQLEQFQNTTEIAGFFKYRKVIAEKLIIEPGLRAQFYASQAKFSPEPRLGIKFNATDKLRFKAAGGLYTQNLMSTSNERDVVNLFSGFLSGPESSVVDTEGNLTTDKIQKAAHAVAGVEVDITDNIQINVEGYFKDFNQLIIVNRNKVNATDPDFSTEKGEAYGVDFSLKYETSKWYLWSTYSLGKVTRFDGEQTFPTVFDRRHNVNFLLSYNIDEAGDFQVSARWNMGSGFPFTQTQGFYGNQDLRDGISTNVLTSNPNLGIIYDDKRNGGRLPYFHRLDVSLKKTIEFSKYSNLVATLSATNAYNRENIFFVDRITTERVNQLPILPSLGLVYSF